MINTGNIIPSWSHTLCSGTIDIHYKHKRRVK